MGDLVGGLLSLVTGVSCVYMFFYTTRYQFFYGKSYEIVKDIITPLPASFNYWLLKLLYLVGGLLGTGIGVWFVFIKPLL
ncbi:hypothetical protein GCM10010954_29640 [Halobacillus andaensis]|uniref:Uncharacterized protein n=1 Tax=Halobacillus andaensis TaxID=1176239 RepID=A0A917EXY6_HALAA|nr:hypothetical protein [Halobacillus andaensis]MBP2005068.1 hypothetical protein [Halobacillus andaensis]GGF28639.1 hypothetical protein GCM10010954_29640 [Halobacillus andaensis]